MSKSQLEHATLIPEKLRIRKTVTPTYISADCYKARPDPGVPKWGLSKENGVTLQLIVKEVPSIQKIHYQRSLVDQIPQ